MRKVLITATTAAFVLVALSIFAAGAQTINLNAPRFNASGEGDVTTTGSIAAGAAALSIADAATWRVGHGIRVRRAGANTPVHTASVQCSFTGTPPDTDGDGTPDPVDLCEVDLGGPIELRFDELRVRINPSVPTTPGALRLRVLRADREPMFDLEFPALRANEWTEAFLALKRQYGTPPLQTLGGPQILTLRCQRACTGLTVHLDDLRGVKDFVARVDGIAKTPGGGATFQLNRAASRMVTSELVYHDDTVAVRAWLQEANTPGGATLFAPAGVYYINTVELPVVGSTDPTVSLPLYNDIHLKCASPKKTIFKNTGQSETGLHTMFRAAASAPTNMIIEQCGFDWNGWNRQDYGSVLLISPSGPYMSQNIAIRDNRFFDSHVPGLEGCDFGQDPCATRQRHHILVYSVDGLWVENNDLSGGGRIKTGGSGLGRNMYIRSNVLDFVNDNGITIVDTVAGRTEHVEITDNSLNNPIGAGIYFGTDGELFGDVSGMIVRDVTVARNRITGFFTAGISSILPETAEGVRVIDNVIQAQRDTDPGPGQFVHGILLKRGNAATHIATDIHVEGNTVVAFGSHAAFNVAGMLLGGPVQDLTVADNDVRCEGCLGMDRGIWLGGGKFENVEILDNNVNNAGQALLVGYDVFDTWIRVTNTTILGNTLLNSTGPSDGQISLIANAESIIEARIANNIIHGGRGYGIRCQGAALFELTDLPTNDFVGNVQGDISGCDPAGIEQSGTLRNAGQPN